MGWSPELQTLRDQLTEALIIRCREEIDRPRNITPDTDPCRQLGICEEDLDEVQLDAAASLGLRLPYPGEPLVLPWRGPKGGMSIAELAGWIAVNARPAEAEMER
jgi:hypothetical protein